MAAALGGRGELEEAEDLNSNPSFLPLPPSSLIPRVRLAIDFLLEPSPGFPILALNFVGGSRRRKGLDAKVVLRGREAGRLEEMQIRRNRLVSVLASSEDGDEPFICFATNASL